MVEVEELTYEKIRRIMNEQDRLMAEGKMERQEPIRGLSPEGERALKEGIRLDDYAKLKGFSL
ncbi:hypothetical protein FACS1894182_06700 [Bacteroidia bacterium]|nr:hypothetical protein FACS1894182_06700 [Bacteroidia bacterium]